MAKVKEDTFVTILPFMVNDLNLRGNELIAYAIIHGFTMHGESGWFTGSASYIASWCNCSKPTVFNALGRLVEKGFIERRERHTNGMTLVDYRSRNLTTPVKNLDGGDKDSLSGGGKESCLQSIEVDTDRRKNREIEREPARSEEKDEGKGKGREPKHRHGQYGNVLLSDSELSSLREQFPDDLDSRIERLSDYIECTGKRYKSHAAVIRTWAKRDGERRQQERASDARRVPESLSDVGKRFVETPYGMVPEYEYKPEEKIAAQPPYYRRLYMKSVDRWQRQYKEALAKGGVKIVKRVE